MATLTGRVAVVAGASRGAGRGIALALGDAGATVYVVGRSTRGGPPPSDGAPGTIEETAEAVTARGGIGIPVRTDCTSETEVAELFARVEREQGALDVLASAVWGAADGTSAPDEAMAGWGTPFWERSTSEWRRMMDAGPRAYYLTAFHAARLMARRKRGLIVGVTDGFLDGTPAEVLTGASAGEYNGMLLYDLSHTTINRLLLGMAADAKKSKLAVVTLMPGFMQTERVKRAMTSKAVERQFRYDLSESVEYVGRAVVALAADKHAIKKSGRIHFVADLAAEYGFTDVDGRRIPRFDPFGHAKAVSERR
ncbi:MAG: SDR family NAD(P)-dependent oxidoreductase [Gemmatimonadaceae bacterium]|nr:SDR family NAD(P)-dependent oxidoreductase [Gemmatimonadaceae bacterium]MCW5825677.1 SDR family NAD(P)-dependent oxidoreductase [Gemmatimonadaceae bacterium]